MCPSAIACPDRVRRLLVRPTAPRDQQRALRVRMQVVDAGEQLLSLQLLRPTCCENDRDGSVSFAKRLELLEGSLAGRPADDAIVARVALELARDQLERFGVFIDGEDERELAHGSGRNAARCHSPGEPLELVDTAVLEAESGCPGKCTCHVGDDDLARLRRSHDSRGLVYRDATDVLSDELDFADVNTDADLQAAVSPDVVGVPRHSAAPAPGRRTSRASRRPWYPPRARRSARALHGSPRRARTGAHATASRRARRPSSSSRRGR